MSKWKDGNLVRISLRGGGGDVVIDELSEGKL